MTLNCTVKGHLRFRNGIATVIYVSLTLGSMLCHTTVGAQEAEGVQVNARLPAFRGNITLQSQDGSKTQPSSGDALPTGTLLKVEKDAGALIRSLPGVSMVANAGCELRLGACIYGGERATSTWDATLVKGSCRVEVDINARAQGAPNNTKTTEARITTTRCVVVVTGGVLEMAESLNTTTVKRSEGANPSSTINIIGGSGVNLDQGSILILRGSGQAVTALLYNPATGTLAPLSPAGQLGASRPVSASEISLLLQTAGAANLQFGNSGTTIAVPSGNPDFSQAVTIKPIASPTSP